MQINYVICLLAAFPLSLAFRYVHGAALRHIVGIALGLAFGLFCFGTYEILELKLSTRFS